VDARQDRHGDAIVVVLSGMLVAASSHTARRELESAAAAAAAADLATVVVDVAGVTEVDVLGTAVLLDAARRSQAGRPRHLVVAGAQGRLAEALRRARVAELVPFSTDASTALAHAADDPHWHREEVDLPQDVSAASRARQLVRDVCARWHVRDLSDDATLLASELVTNAIRHAQSAPHLRVALRPRELVVAVSDSDPTPPRMGRNDPEAPGGRGLRLVDTVASAWGVERNPTEGKTVWCALARP
jgi:anti-sigma regulatory factor (Ser/Thr protein kinase)/anti-anti-sigma regulatory factor